MRYLLAIILPPVALLLCGKVFQAILCLVLMLTLIGWPIAAVWALFVVHNHLADLRAQRVIEALDQQKKW